MPRNLERRVEILFPVDRPELKEELLHILNIFIFKNLFHHAESNRRFRCGSRFTNDIYREITVADCLNPLPKKLDFGVFFIDRLRN